MPTSHSEVPALSSKAGNYSYRHREWVRTPNYSTVPRADLPINHYGDSRLVLTVNSRSPMGYTRVSDGVWVQTSPGGYDQFADGYAIIAQDEAISLRAGVNAKIVSLQNEIFIDLLGKVADQKVNLAVALAEGRKTADMILGSAKRISNAYRAFRRGNFREVAKQLDITPSRVHKNWLAYKYGWMPILMDVKGGAEALAQHHVGRPLRFSVKGTRSASFERGEIVPVPIYGAQGTKNRVLTLTGGVTVRGYMYLEITNPNTSTLQQLGLTNPALVAWELVPFSFVFDWFISVGDYLKGLTALHGVAVRRSGWSRVIDTSFTFNQPMTLVEKDGRRYFDDKLVATVRRRDYGRDPLVVDPASLYPPSKVAQLSENRENGTFVKLVTSLALLRALHA
jgi:hypothetical protein